MSESVRTRGLCLEWDSYDWADAEQKLGSRRGETDPFSTVSTQQHADPECTFLGQGELHMRSRNCATLETEAGFGVTCPSCLLLAHVKTVPLDSLWSVTVKLLVFQILTSDWLEWCIFSLFSRQLNSSFYFHTWHQAVCKLVSSVIHSLKRRQMLTLSFPKWPYFQPLDSVFEIFSGLGHKYMERHWKQEVKRAFLVFVATTYFCFCSSSHCDPLGQCSVFMLTLGCGTPCRSHRRVMLSVTLYKMAAGNSSGDAGDGEFWHMGEICSA